MDSLSLLIAEAAILERQRELEAITNGSSVSLQAGHGLRHSLASTSVRLGLRLDPAAGEGLPAFDVTLASQEGGC